MRLHYTVSEDDYIAFNLYHVRHMANYRRTIICLCLLVPVLLAGVTPVMFLSFDRFSLWLWLCVATAVSGVWVLLVPGRFAAMIRRHIKKITRERNEFTGEFSLELRDEDMVYAGRGERSEIAYNRSVKVVEDQELVYLFLGALSAIVLPPGAFAQESKEALFHLLRAKCPQVPFA